MGEGERRGRPAQGEAGTRLPQVQIVAGGDHVASATDAPCRECWHWHILRIAFLDEYLPNTLGLVTKIVTTEQVDDVVKITRTASLAHRYGCVC